VAYGTLIGQRFGKLVVISQEPSNKRRSRRWLCECDCGNTHVVTTAHLRDESTKSCGCERSKWSFQDLTGQKFGKLTVIEQGPTTKLGYRQWICQCDCGAKCCIRGFDLTKRNTKSCGCLQRPNLVGKVFGELTVLQQGKSDGHGNRLWWCKCSCGNKLYVTTGSLQSGGVKSCGHLKTFNVIGKVLGKLTVIKKGSINNKRARLWLCKCSCGNETYVTTSQLNSGKKKSCGCLRKKLGN